MDDLTNGNILPVYELVVQALDGGVPRLTNESKVFTFNTLTGPAHVS